MHYSRGKVMLNGFLTLCLLVLSLQATAAEPRDQVAVLYLYPSDAAANGVFTQSEMDNHFAGPVRDFWLEQSYGRYDPETTVFTWRLPVDSTVTVPANGSLVIDMLNNVLPGGGNFVIPGYDPSQYSKTLILLGGGVFGFGGGYTVYSIKVNGVSYTGVPAGSFTYFHPEDQFYESDILFQYFEDGDPYVFGYEEVATYPELGLQRGDKTLLHEWGHGLGLSSHANYWRSEIEPFYGEIYWWRQKNSLWDQTRDYGNMFDVMGRSLGYALHITAFYKDLLGWFAPDEKLVVAQSTQDILISPLQSQQPGLVRAVQVPIAAGKFTRPAPFDSTLDYSFYIEYRRGMGLDKHLSHPYLQSNTEGLLVTMARSDTWSGGVKVFVNSWLLDMSPDNIVYDPSPTLIEDATHRNHDDHHEASLNANRAFYDAQTGVSLTHIRPQGDAGLMFNVGRDTLVGVPSGVHTTALSVGESQAASVDGLFYSEDLKYRLDLAPNGRLVITENSTGLEVLNGVPSNVPLFATADTIALTPSGLELRAGEVPLWVSDTTVPVGSHLLINAGGQVSIVDANDNVIWPPPSLIFKDGFETP